MHITIYVKTQLRSNQRLSIEGFQISVRQKGLDVYGGSAFRRRHLNQRRNVGPRTEIKEL